ncbi:MAG TPA: DUF4829 domain-containing protein [Syntrophomonadaceae bacterium]|nr:DUF4829 domain-containing protein [Syntrophomonadaceae bacterium]
MRGTLLIVILLTSVFQTGCLFEKSPPPKVDGLGPQKLVETYYRSVSRGDLATARACLSGDLLPLMNSAEDSDFNNLVALWNLKVSEARPIPLYGKNIDEVQVVVEYNAVYRKVITSGNGRQMRFVYVARKTKDAPWKIISIGTGP